MAHKILRAKRGTPAPLNHRRPSTFPARMPGCGRTLLGLLAALSAGLPTVFAAVTVVVLVSLFPAMVEAQGNAQEPCSGDGLYNPTPTPIEVAAVPIVVESTAEEYFVLYVEHDLDGATVEIPVLVKRGAAGTTTLAENVEALPKERYRVEKYLIADPADVDGDCIDDITELDGLGSMNPVNPAAAIALSVGTVAIPDRDTFDKLSYSDKYIKFVMFGMDTADRPGVYFMNTENYPDHRQFMEVIGLDWEQDGLLNGELTFHPELMSPSGNLGVYYYEFQREPIFSLMGHSHTLLAASIPLLDDNLALYISNGYLQYSQAELPLFRESRIPLLFDEDIHADTSFLSLNPGEGYGLLRVMDPDERPHPRDIVIYEALPNELPRVAGIISTVPQTPLSHVNLRAIQDAIPNAFIRDALDQPDIDNLIGAHVHYTVDASGYSISAATRAEVDAHYASSRPAQRQTPQRDLSVRAITPLSEIGFDDWDAFGVKAANVAVLGTLGFPAGTVPDGFAIPFYFYDEFMTDSGLYDDIKDMLAASDFQTDFDTQESELKKLRKAIKDAETPEWMTTALTTMHATFPVGISLRYRSSTNNEDLPGFNGAGLYDSKTQHPEETEEDGIAKSLKQVYASLWNFRAFTERDFNRVDHLAAKMGVLVHPNYSDELANGVAVSFDPIRGLDGYYYVNTQVGEDLVTNPEAHSIPEELLLRRDQGTYAVLSTSNLVESGELLMSDAQLIQLRDHLTVIHERFAVLYNPAPDEPFAMEIEFKITSENVLAIKQARPWVFDTATETVTPPPPPPPDPPPSPPPSPPRRWWWWWWRAPNGAGRAHKSDGGSHRCGGDADLGRAGERRRRGDYGLRVPDRREGTLDFHRLHRHHPYGHRSRQRPGLCLPGAGGQQQPQGPGFQPGRGDTEDAGGSGLYAFRQRDRHHLRDGARERVHPADPARPLLLRSGGPAHGSRIGGGHHGRSGDPGGRQPEHLDGDGAAGRTHDLDPRPRRASERFGKGGRFRFHRRGPAL